MPLYIFCIKNVYALNYCLFYGIDMGAKGRYGLAINGFNPYDQHVFKLTVIL
jgi:hypothetical protein